jgi:hypothetical protein
MLGGYGDYQGTFAERINDILKQEFALYKLKLINDAHLFLALKSQFFA